MLILCIQSLTVQFNPKDVWHSPKKNVCSKRFAFQKNGVRSKLSIFSQPAQVHFVLYALRMLAWLKAVSRNKIIKANIMDSKRSRNKEWKKRINFKSQIIANTMTTRGNANECSLKIV